MVKHIVMWRLEDFAKGGTKSENIMKIKQGLEMLPGKIPEIKNYRVGVNEVKSERAADLLLISGFDSWADLDKYRTHPEHLKIADLIKKLVSESRVVDFETE